MGEGGGSERKINGEMRKEEEGDEIKRRGRGMYHVCRLRGWGKFGFLFLF